jgi:hypothetical protein
MLEDQKTKATNHLLVLNRRIDEFEARFNSYVPWVQQKGQVGYMNQESRISQWPANCNAGKSFKTTSMIRLTYYPHKSIIKDLYIRIRISLAQV